MEKCEQCLHSRPIVSENGIHYGCCLSAKKAAECMCGVKDYRERKPMVNDGKRNMSRVRVHL